MGLIASRATHPRTIAVFHSGHYYLSFATFTEIVANNTYKFVLSIPESATTIETAAIYVLVCAISFTCSLNQRRYRH